MCLHAEMIPPVGGVLHQGQMIQARVLVEGYVLCQSVAETTYETNKTQERDQFSFSM